MSRDRLTWTAYVLLGWFAYLQAAPGLVVPHLRDDLGLSYSTGGLYVAAFAGGAATAGLVSARVERLLGRGPLLWWSPVVMALGTAGLTAGRDAGTTLGGACVMGIGGGFLLATIQAALSDRHGDLRAVALAEANVAASLGYLGLVGLLSAASALGVGWRFTLLVSLVVPAVAWLAGRREQVGPAVVGESGVDSAQRVSTAFWLAVGVLVCATAVEWSVTAWGASLVDDLAGVSTDAAVSLMAAYFGGFVVGRGLGSRLAARVEPPTLLAGAMATAGIGFALLWTASGATQAAGGLALLGLGIGNLFPLTVALVVAVGPTRSAVASGRAVTASAAAVLVAPVTVGAVADLTTLRHALLAVPALLTAAAVLLALVVRSRA